MRKEEAMSGILRYADKVRLVYTGSTENPREFLVEIKIIPGLPIAAGQGVSNSALDGINTAAELGGWFSNIWGDAARYSLEGVSKTDVARPLVRGIGIGAKTIGYTGMTVSLGIDMYKYYQNPTWGNAGRVGVDAAAIGISYAWPGPRTALGVGAATLNATGGLNGFYNFLDANQALYNSTGYIIDPFNPLTIIKIK